MKRYVIAGMLITIFAAGCGKKAEEAEKAEVAALEVAEAIQAAPGMGMPPAPEVSPEALKIVSGEMPADSVLVKIGDETLTAGTARMMIEFRIASIINQIPPERVDSIKANMLKSTIEQFVEKTVLIQEARKRKIEATDKDQEAALAEVATQLPPGMTIDEAIAKSPWGKENLMKEMVASIKTRKLIDVIAADTKVTVKDEEIDAFYSENKDRLDHPERLSASHILIMFDKEDTPEAKAEKKKQLEAVRQEVVDGADFAEMAKKHSACSSAPMGGALGEFNRQSPFVQEFKDAAFSQKVDEVGAVFETQFGYHIIKVTEKKDAEAMPREKIKEIVERQKKGTAIQAFIVELREKADVEYPVAL